MNVLIYIPFLVGLVIVGYYLAKRSRLKSSQETFYRELQELPPVSTDFSTPEGAVLCIEEAYRQRDVDAVIAAKDFAIEARLMLEKADLHTKLDDEMLAKASETLLATFKSHLVKKWPDFEGVESYFLRREDHGEKLVVVTEACRQPNGNFSQQRILVAETPQGWRVLNPL